MSALEEPFAAVPSIGRGRQPTMMAMAMSPCSRDPRRAATQPMTTPAIRAGVRTTVQATNTNAVQLGLVLNQHTAITVTRTPNAAKLHRGMRSLPAIIARRKVTGMAMHCNRKCGVASSHRPPRVSMNAATMKTPINSPRNRANCGNKSVKQLASLPAASMASTAPRSRQRQAVGGAGGVLLTAAHAASTAAFTSTGSNASSR